MAMRVSFRERNLTVIAITAVVTLVLAVVVTFRIADLPALAGNTYAADFAEAGGLKPGDPVEVAGVAVGKVKEMSLQGNAVHVKFTVKHLHLGSETKARIKTGSLLGARFVELEPAGSGKLEETIPTSRTSAPYNLSSELIGIAGHTRKIDLDAVSKALQTFSDAVQPSTQEIGPAMSAVTDLSRVVSSRDADLRRLFRRANAVTAVFRDRTKQITTLMRDGQELFAELLVRKAAIEQLFRTASVAADQVSSLVRENRRSLKPALTQLEQTLDVLVKNKDNLRVAIKRVASFITPLGEGVASGPWFFGYLDLAPGLASLNNPASLLSDGGTQNGGQ